MAEADVAEAYVHEGLQLARYGGDGVENSRASSRRSCVEDLADVFAFVLDFERFAVVAFAVADFAGDVHVGQEVHFDFNHAVALAGFAAAAFDVEGESADVEAAFAREGYAGEEFADGGEQAGIGGGVGARGAADGDWSTLMTLSRCSRPRMSSYGAGSSWARLSSRAVILARVSLIRVDLPPPDTPVMQVIKPSGSSRVTFLRLLPRAPLRTSIRSGLTGVRSDGTAMDFCR